MNINLHIVFVSIVVLMFCKRANCLSKEPENMANSGHDRAKRFVFLQTSGIGYLVALAIPTSSVLNQRVYMAFNFEAHYGLMDPHTLLAKFTMPEIPFKQFVGDNISEVKREAHGPLTDARSEHFTEKNNVYTRKNFYRILEQHIDSYGYNGTSCVLRTICEISEMPLYEHNGVFGNIVHILFTPSSSRAEKIRQIYYDAEYYGRQNECHRYYSDCTISLLDLVSDMISISLRKIT